CRHTTTFFTPPCGLTARSSPTFSLPQTYWSIVTGTFFGTTAPVITTTPRMLEAAAGAVTPNDAIPKQTPSTSDRGASMRSLYIAGHRHRIGGRLIGTSCGRKPFSQSCGVEVQALATLRQARAREAGTHAGCPPRARTNAKSLLAGEPVLLDEGPESLGHLSGADRLVTHDRLERFRPSAELDRV